MSVISHRLIVAGDAPGAAYVVYKRGAAWVVGPLTRSEERWPSPWPGREGAVQFAEVNLRIEHPAITRVETHPWPTTRINVHNDKEARGNGRELHGSRLRSRR